METAHRGLVGSLVKKWKDFREVRAAQKELAVLDSSVVARIAADLGISATDLRALAASDRDAADLLKRRLCELRIDPNSIDPAVMRDLQLHCAQCTEKRLCEHELADKPAAASWPKYCPNELTITVVKN